MKYLFIRDGIVAEIIPEEYPIFPGIPITERFAPDFLAKCEAVPDEVPAPMEPTPGVPIDQERNAALEAAVLTLMGGV